MNFIMIVVAILMGCGNNKEHVETIVLPNTPETIQSLPQNPTNVPVNVQVTVEQPVSIPPNVQVTNTTTNEVLINTTSTQQVIVLPPATYTTVTKDEDEVLHEDVHVKVTNVTEPENHREHKDNESHEKREDSHKHDKKEKHEHE